MTMIQKNRPNVKTILWKTILGMGLERCQRSNDLFSVEECEKEVLQEFNSSVGYRKRSLKQEDKE